MFIAMWVTNWIRTWESRAPNAQVKRVDYIVAARALGFSRLRIMSRTPCPAISSASITSPCSTPYTRRLLGAFLGYLGLGVQDPLVLEWGK